jgi:methanethiol S-methyltransferase
MGRVLTFIYGVLAYGVFVVVFLYMIGFVGNMVVPKSYDHLCGVSSFCILPDQITLIVSSWLNPCGAASLRVLA